MVDLLDDWYFELEESGGNDAASEAFMAARFMAAVLAYQTAATNFDFCEAAYEALFAAM